MLSSLPGHRTAAARAVNVPTDRRAGIEFAGAAVQVNGMQGHRGRICGV